MFAFQVPPVECDRWEVQWADTRSVVGCDVIASALYHMRLTVQPVMQEVGEFAPFSSPAPITPGLSFRSRYITEQ